MTRMDADTVTEAGGDWPLSELTYVPRTGPMVCPTCHSWKADTDPLCGNCSQIQSIIGTRPLTPSVITLYKKPSLLRDWLTRYKGRPGTEDPFEPESEQRIREIVRHFAQDHWPRISAAMAPVDAIIVVPSQSRIGPHPLTGVTTLETQALLEATGEPIGFRRPNPLAFRAAGPVKALRVYLLDDVYTTGAHLNSAAAALGREGAEVVGATVIARRVNPQYSDLAAEFWATARETPFTWVDGPYVCTRRWHD